MTTDGSAIVRIIIARSMPKLVARPVFWTVDRRVRQHNGRNA
jgi:hypothetical protein